MKVEAVFAKSEGFQTAKASDLPKRTLYRLTVVLAVGIFCGVLMVLTNKTLFSGTLQEEITTFHESFQNDSFLRRFFGFVCCDTWFFALLFLCGSSNYGKQITYALLFLKASGIGALAAVYIQNLGQQGVGAYYIGVFPGKCLLLLVLLMMGQNCIHNEAELRQSFGKQGSANKNSCSMYVLRSAVIYIILLISDLLNAGLPK